ncbi:DMT family transporter [Saccharopolyspora dendranthemae]|uniref:Drug/metabolite transporter (DMT)-like permease n=1 Tax=Saccharopolyspora dendranthemae TaxID=1181886 RepID=A0A561U0V2_9PSEU|nr:DMT family transporter [Saccharopolyspora dendranthemae]TWF93005.1 drug/metabolite transporter (DMT)-like permease [Saccharopolyspora dendranthemae]
MNNPASYLRLGALALFWGASFLLIKLGLEAMSPTQIAFARIVLGALTLLAICAVRGLRIPGDRNLWKHVAVAALLSNALPWVLLAAGEQSVESGLAGVLNATTPLWTVLFGLLAGREALPPRRAAGLLLGFLGVLVIFAPWQGGGLLSWGVLSCVAAAASYGIGFVYTGRFITGRGTPPLALAGMQLTAAIGFSLLALPIGGLRLVHWNPVALLAILALGVVGTGIGFALNYRLIGDEGATTASTVTYIMPAFSVLLGWILLGEQLPFRVLLGMAVVLVGVAMTHRKGSGQGMLRGRVRGAFMRGSQLYAELATNHPMK